MSESGSDAEPVLVVGQVAAEVVVVPAVLFAWQTFADEKLAASSRAGVVIAASAGPVSETVPLPAFEELAAIEELVDSVESAVSEDFEEVWQPAAVVAFEETSEAVMTASGSLWEASYVRFCDEWSGQTDSDSGDPPRFG